MKEIHKHRLLKLYNHAKQPQEKWSHQEFNFSHFHKDTSCGTVGCLAGELPALFPRYWKFDVFGDPYRPGHSVYTANALAEFFGINKEEAYHLFYPTSQQTFIDPYYKSHDWLDCTATKKQVVENLKRFLIIKGIL